MKRTRIILCIQLYTLYIHPLVLVHACDYACSEKHEVGSNNEQPQLTITRLEDLWLKINSFFSTVNTCHKYLFINQSEQPIKISSKHIYELQTIFKTFSKHLYMSNKLFQTHLNHKVKVFCIYFVTSFKIQIRMSLEFDFIIENTLNFNITIGTFIIRRKVHIQWNKKTVPFFHILHWWFLH